MDAALITSATTYQIRTSDCAANDALAASGAVRARNGGPPNCFSGDLLLPDGSIVNNSTVDRAVAFSSGLQSVLTNAQGTGRASVDFGDVVGAPVLKAQADSTNDGGVYVTANAIQRFDNTGDTPITTVFGGDVDYILSGNPVPAPAGTPPEPSGVFAAMTLFTTSDGFIDVNLGSTPELISALAPFPLANRFGGTTFVAEFDEVGANAFSLFSGEITIDPGASLFVAVTLEVGGFRGENTDAFSTFNTGFYEEINGNLTRIVDPQNLLISSISPIQIAQGIPVTSSVSLLSIGLLALIGRRRRTWRRCF